MTVLTPDPGAPRKVLLATDLSARCDRALERAVSIARRHDAHLVIVHVLEDFDEPSQTYRGHSPPSWRRPPDAVAMMKRRAANELRADLDGAVENATILIEQGDPAEILEKVAISEQPDLVVTGLAREGLFANHPVVLGKNVEQLLRRLPVPILIVKRRVRSAYQHILVTTDFLEPSAHALQAALRFFPVQDIHLLHASEAPYASLVSDSEAHLRNFRETRASELVTYLASIFMSESDWNRLVRLIEVGMPQQRIREYVEQRGADLVVLGTHGRSAVLELFLGSTAKSILSTLPCDALVMRGPSK